MTRYQISSRVINAEQMEIKIEHERACIFCVYFKLLHGLYASSIDVEELVVEDSVQYFKVDLCVLFHLLEHACYRLSSSSVILNIIEGLSPPV